MRDLVDIVVPVHNAERFLRSTVASVQAQTHTNWRLHLCLDPASQDASATLAQSWARSDKRIYFHSSPRRGVAAARNLGLDQASAKWVALLDADDQWLPLKLQKQIEFMTTTGAALSGTAFRRLDEAGLRVGRLISVPDQIHYERLLGGNCLLCSTTMMLRDAVGDGRFQEQGCEDFAFWLRFLRRSAVARGLNLDLARYRVVRGSRGTNKWRTVQEAWSIYRNQEAMSRSRATLRMAPYLTFGLRKHFLF